MSNLFLYHIQEEKTQIAYIGNKYNNEGEF